MADFTPADLLTFEAQWWQHMGIKERAIRERFGLSPIRYYQVLNLYVDTDAAVRQDPVTTRRLRAVRGAQRRLLAG